MSKQHLQLKPHHHKGDETWWWYEDSTGIDIVVEDKISGRVRFVTIPWRSIKAALRRLDKE